MQTEQHPSFAKAKAFIEGLGIGLIVKESEPKYDPDARKTYAMIEVDMMGPRPMMHAYKPSPVNDRFCYGNQKFFVEWARKVYRFYN